MEDGDSQLGDGFLLARDERQTEYLGLSDHPVAPDVDLEFQWTGRQLHGQPQFADVEIDRCLDPHAGAGDR